RLESLLARLPQDWRVERAGVFLVGGAPKPLPHRRPDGSRPAPLLRRPVRRAKGHTIASCHATARSLDQGNAHGMRIPARAGLTIDRITDPLDFTALREE